MPRYFTGSSGRVEDAGALAPRTRADHLLEAVYESDRLILLPPRTRGALARRGTATMASIRYPPR